MTVFRRYLLFQIPGWILAALVLAGLHHWFGLPASLAAALFAGYVVKDFLFYPFLRRSYEQDGRSQVEQLIGLDGVVADAVAPVGYVRVRGELWRAEGQPPADSLPVGTRVTVEGVKGWTLLVRRTGANQK